jgi:preprotein translocase subunit SecA
MLGFIKKIFGTKHDRDVQELQPLVQEINQVYSTLSSKSDEEIKEISQGFRTRINETKLGFITEREELRKGLLDGDIDHDERLEIYRKLEENENAEFLAVREILDDILPEAFALVKDVSRRLTERKHQYDINGHTTTWAMIPYDVQLMGGMVIHQGKIAEMTTGEGKTLVAVSPMYLNALSGYGVHLVTVNDYLARRDCEWMKPVFDFLGVTVGCIQSNMDPQERKVHYNADITYGTNNEFGFDYLRDNMVGNAEDMVQRPHFFAIVDEVDSVLIDEARTPLIISGPVSSSSDAKFVEMNPRVRRLVDAQSRLVNSIVGEAEAKLKSSDKEQRQQAGIALLRAHRAFPKHKRLQKLLQEPDNVKLMNSTENEYMRDQSARMHEIDDELYYTIDEKQHSIDIHEKGRALLASANEDANMFLIPDITSEMSAIEGDTSLSDEDKQRQKDLAMMLYAERSDRIHIVSQLLRGYSLYERDVEYVVQDNKVKIVDEHTGRILDGRRYSDGLHQAIEAKEGVVVERDTQTYATVTLQNYFRLYRKLAGMTGTAETEAGEFEKIYKLDVVVIPTNKPAIRKDMNDLIYRTKREKYNAVAEEVQRQITSGRAVLVGTASVEVSEILSKMLRRLNIPHNVLNAKHHEREAEIVAEAGRKGAVTIATNMAGRGTDIKLDPEVKESGGLCIIGTERHESRRIDRQLRGRSGRQGDPGSSQFFISLEDDLMRLFGGERITSFMQTFKVEMQEGEPLEASMVTKSVERAQKKVEENNFGIRKRLLDYDDVMNQQREVVYDRRRHALHGERMKSEIFAYVQEIAGALYDEHHVNHELDIVQNQVRTLMLSEIEVTENEFRGMKREEFVDLVVNSAEEFYKRKEEALGSEFMAQLERFAIIQSIDDKWREHLRTMDEIKEGIHLRALGQKDPLLEYKGEAYRQFEDLILEISKSSVEVAFKYYPVVEQQREQTPPPQRVVRSSRSQIKTDENGVPVNTSVSTGAMSFSHPTTTEGYYSNSTPDDDSVAQQAPQRSKIETVYREEPRVGRNDPCPCGSGKKYKQCHGKESV